MRRDCLVTGYNELDGVSLFLDAASLTLDIIAGPATGRAVGLLKFLGKSLDGIDILYTQGGIEDALDEGEVDGGTALDASNWVVDVVDFSSNAFEEAGIPYFSDVYGILTNLAQAGPTCEKWSDPYFVP